MEFLLHLPFSEDATAIGSAYFISNGVYFGKGTFLKRVSDQTLILDQYTNTPSYRIGLTIEETIINSDLDPHSLIILQDLTILEHLVPIDLKLLHHFSGQERFN